MPRYELPVATVLASSAVCSAIAFLLTITTEGKIHLPADDHDEKDPFNVATAEDVIDGYPIDETKFWAQVRLRKLVLTLLLAIALAIEAVSLGFTIANNNTLVSVLRLFFYLHTLLLSASSITQTNVTDHARSVLHLCVLTLLATALQLVAGILPSGRPPVVQSLSSSFSTITLTLTTISSIITSTLPTGPPLHVPPASVYDAKTLALATTHVLNNVSGETGASLLYNVLFSYATSVIMLAYTSDSPKVSDLPIPPSKLRAPYNFSLFRRRLALLCFPVSANSGWRLAYKLARINITPFACLALLAGLSASFLYAPMFFIQRLVSYLEADPQRDSPQWGWVYAAGLFGASVVECLTSGQMWSLASTTMPCRLRSQLNTSLFAKTLVRKDTTSFSNSPSDAQPDKDKDNDNKQKGGESDFGSKAHIMTLMTADVDRVGSFAHHVYTLVDSPIEIIIASFFLYKLIGVSCFFGLAASCISIPLNLFAGSLVVKAQVNLMKAKDERIALMNEALGAIRMLKLMAWERCFEQRVLKAREKELKYQKLHYTVEATWKCIWKLTPIVVTLVSFFHFAYVREQVLTPATAFTSIAIFNQLRHALNALPPTFVVMLQSLVSLRRIETYLNSPEVSVPPPFASQDNTIALHSATVTWPSHRTRENSDLQPSPRSSFVLVGLSLMFPRGEMSLVCGKLGSGKTLLLLALLGEADVLEGRVMCPRSPPDALASFAGAGAIRKEAWIVEGMCAYVPQVTWLRNASIKENILFNLPLDEERYQRTLEVCALIPDLKILEDGDESEIGELGVNLSGGQKARVSLARAVYSRASILLLDDVLSAVDAHTTHHLYHECLKGDLMRGRTIILVSHHVALCAPGAAYVVVLDNGRLQFQGDRHAVLKSNIIAELVQSGASDSSQRERTDKDTTTARVTMNAPIFQTGTPKKKKAAARKLIEEEERAIGRVRRDVWELYVKACGDGAYWALFTAILIAALLSPIAQNKWLEHWSRIGMQRDHMDNSLWYVGLYTAITVLGLFVTTVQWFVIYKGSINASHALHKRLLERVLFATIRFHESVSRGRLLNRFGKDLEGIDSSLSEEFGWTLMNGLSALIAFITVSIVGGLPFVTVGVLIGYLYFNVAKVYGKASRDMRRLGSVTKSPLYSIYGETISGVAVLRAFGASSKFLRDMLRCVDVSTCPDYWMWGVNRWLSARFNLLSAAVVGATALVAIFTPQIDAALAGFALAFATDITGDILNMVRHVVGLEQAMVALERVKEYSELVQEPPEFIEPRPPASWPSEGAIHCENLVVRYAPDLPDVLHKINYDIHPGEKVGILGRTGSGKSTLALSLLRFVEATEGYISVDGINIAALGLADLRNKLIIIPQDPTLLSGTLRSTLDVFDEYEDTEIFEALRRVHLIPSSDALQDVSEINSNVFRNLDCPVSEAGDNFSMGEKQLLCLARAILKRSKVLIMDEATASVDYGTDELISKTIRQDFASSTIITIAHRLRTVMDYDRVMVLEEGRIIEFDRPAVLLSDPNTRFYSLCQATGETEFSTLIKMAGITSADRAA